MIKNKHAFTLVEILLVAVLFSVIGMVVFNAFSNGLKLWAKADRLIIESNIVMLLDRMGEDLRSIPIITEIPFKGSTNQMSFSAYVLMEADLHGARAQEGIVEQVGAVQYRFEPAEGKIYRRQANYGQALKGSWHEPLVVAMGVEAINVRYYVKSQRGLDVKSEVKETIPAAVIVDVQFSVDGGERHMRRFFQVPVGGGL